MLTGGEYGGGGAISRLLAHSIYLWVQIYAFLEKLHIMHNLTEYPVWHKRRRLYVTDNVVTGIVL